MNNIMNDNKPKGKMIRLPIYNHFKKLEKNVKQEKDKIKKYKYINKND